MQFLPFYRFLPDGNPYRSGLRELTGIFIEFSPFLSPLFGYFHKFHNSLRAKPVARLHLDLRLEGRAVFHVTFDNSFERSKQKTGMSWLRYEVIRKSLF